LFADGDRAGIDGYAEAALDRIWRAQHFSWWMTSMLHAGPDDTEFDTRRRFGELGSVVRSRAGSTYLAEAYTGWPLDLGV
jgi:p-hydroxybenzoate 3-monooxygenase